MYLAQNTDSIQKAINIAITWFVDDYNIGEYYDNDKDNNKEIYKFTLYSYTNMHNIKKTQIEGNEFFKEIKIVGYKKNNTPHYTVLLPLI